MNSTRAAEANTHAVSPASIFAAATSTLIPPRCPKNAAGNLVPAGALLLHRVPRLAGGHQDRVPHGGERRGVGEIEVEQVLDGELGGDGGGQHVDALGRSLLADDLGADQLAAASLAEDLDGDGLGAREVAGPRRAFDVADDVTESHLLGLALGEAGAGDLGVAQLGDSGADHAGE